MLLHDEEAGPANKSPVRTDRYFCHELLIFLQSGRVTIVIATCLELLLLGFLSAAPLSCKIPCLCQHARHGLTRDNTCKATFSICMTTAVPLCKQQSAHHDPSP